MAMFKLLHPENLNQLRALLTVIQPVWFHADGNMYHIEKESTDRKLFVNYNQEGTNHPANTGARYRVKFMNASEVPTTLDTLERMFLDSKQQEDVDGSEPIERKGNFVFSVPKPEEIAPGKSIPSPDDTSAVQMKVPKAKPLTAAEKKAAELAALTTGEPAAGEAGAAGEATT